MIVGTALGSALTGLRPVAGIVFIDFTAAGDGAFRRAMIVQEDCRAAGLDVPIPYSPPLEKPSVPSVWDIVAAARRLS